MSAACLALDTLRTSPTIPIAIGTGLSNHPSFMIKPHHSLTFVERSARREVALCPVGGGLLRQGSRHPFDDRRAVAGSPVVEAVQCPDSPPAFPAMPAYGRSAAR